MFDLKSNHLLPQKIVAQCEQISAIDCITPNNVSRLVSSEALNKLNYGLQHEH
jgi:hypothetical protein